MDIKTIMAKFDEIGKKRHLFYTFEKTMKQIEAEYDKLMAEQNKYFKGRSELFKEIDELDTLGVKAFEDYKKHVLAQINSDGLLRQLPIKPMEKEIEAQIKEADEEFRDWIDRKSSALPKDLKAGMTIYSMRSGSIAELLSDPDKGRVMVQLLSVSTGEVEKDVFRMTYVTPQNFKLLRE